MGNPEPKQAHAVVAPPGPSNAPGAAESAVYIREMAAVLARLARDNQDQLLCYFLEMAVLEADNVLRRARSADAEGR